MIHIISGGLLNMRPVFSTVSTSYQRLRGSTRPYDWTASTHGSYTRNRYVCERYVTCDRAAVNEAVLAAKRFLTALEQGISGTPGDSIPNCDRHPRTHATQRKHVGRTPEWYANPGVPANVAPRPVTKGRHPATARRSRPQSVRACRS